MRATLLTAQRMADSIVHEAESKRDSILVQTDADIDKRKQQLQKELTALETRMREGQTELKNELFRKENDTYSFVDDTTCRYECTLTEEELAEEQEQDQDMDEDGGNIVCIKTFRPKGKDGDLQMTFLLDDMF